MNLEEYLWVIEQESDKLILRYHAYHNGLHHDRVRIPKAVRPTKKVVQKPDYWKEDKSSIPLCKEPKTKKALLRSIAKKISKNI